MQDTIEFIKADDEYPYEKFLPLLKDQEQS